MLPSLKSISKRIKKTDTAARLLGRSRKWARATRSLLEDLAETRNALRAPAAPAPLSFSETQGRDTTSLSEHLAALVDKRLKKLLLSADFAASEDPIEALHDLRVASRRLRAFLDVFDPLLDPEIAKSAKKPVRRITRAAGELRDWDVQRELLEKRLQEATSDAERGALEHVLEDIDAHRRKSEKKTLKELRRVDLDAVRHAVCAALGDAVSGLPEPGAATLDFVWATLTTLASDATYDASGDSTSRSERMHATRIDLKRLRYGLELFEPVLRPRYKDLYARVVELQNVLGTHHDLVVLGELVSKHRAELDRHHRETLKAGLIQVENRLAAEREALERDFSVRGFDEAAFVGGLRDALTVGPPTGALPATDAPVPP